MKSYIKSLQKLTDEIKALSNDEEKKINLVNKYNSDLYEILPLLRKPLPKDCELNDDLILSEYKKFRDEFKVKGYFNFKKYISVIDVIAEVRIRKVKKRGAIVHAELINLYKGEAPATFTIDVILSWKPDKWFRVNENCLVFLSCDSPEKYLASSIKSKMPIDIENNVKYLFSYNCELKFWEGARAIPVPTTQWDDMIKVRYDDVVKLIVEA